MVSETANQDDALEQTITSCLDLDNPKSFFLYAGAGTGKTRAVVRALEIFKGLYGVRFRQSGQKVAVITYTNAACDEIKRRTDFDPMFVVSTIHSFAWEQIRTYHKDIRGWLKENLDAEIAQLKQKQQTGRRDSKAAAEREVQIQSKNIRLDQLDDIKQFTYIPNGENSGKDSLNHAEVLSITAAFLGDKALMRQILVRKYPVLFIDESQDTKQDLIEAFLTLQEKHADKFCLSLFGDMMQRIYAEGKVGLEEAIPADWTTFAIDVNHRCPTRVVDLLNRIRLQADGAQQQPRLDAQEGSVRLFLINDFEGLDKQKIESTVASKMADATSDDEWQDRQAIKVLTLEHNMAARRGGFDQFFEPLYRIDAFKTGLLDGSLTGITFFVQQLLPLIKAMQNEDRFDVARIVRKYSPIVNTEKLRESTNSIEELRKAAKSVESVFSLWDDGADPALMDLLSKIDHESLFDIPDIFQPIMSTVDWQEEEFESFTGDKEKERNPKIDAWRHALAAPFSQLEAYVGYIKDHSIYGTHQGVKGLQFPRVMVILDDAEARGFMFSYEKLLGAKAPSKADEKNRLEKKDTSIERTRRLFYVTCSRAQQSLAVVVYTKEVSKVANHMLDIGWFENAEIIRI